MPEPERNPKKNPRAAALRRSWLFLPGADREALLAAADSGADLLVQELEDFVTPAQRPEARALSAEVMEAWRGAGTVTAIRVNPFWDEGLVDLEAAMRAGPDVVMLPKVSEPDQMRELDRAVASHERVMGLVPGRTELVANIESARGLIQTYAIATASPRVSACLVASEDMATDLGAERGRDGAELAYVRARFHTECVAAGVVSVDCPYTWRDEAGLIADARYARRLGYVAKSAVVRDHAVLINQVFTPSQEEVAKALALAAAFEAAREAGTGVTRLDDNMVELPTYLTAKRLLARAQALAEA